MPALRTWAMVAAVCGMSLSLVPCLSEPAGAEGITAGRSATAPAGVDASIRRARQPTSVRLSVVHRPHRGFVARARLIGVRGSAPITFTFRAGALLRTVHVTTDTSGLATATFRLPRGLEDVQAGVEYDGNSRFAPSWENGPVLDVHTRLLPNFQLTAPLVVNRGDRVVATARLYGDPGAPLAFAVAINGRTHTFQAVTDRSGLASITFTPTADGRITVSNRGDARYRPFTATRDFGVDQSGPAAWVSTSVAGRTPAAGSPAPTTARPPFYKIDPPTSTPAHARASAASSAPAMVVWVGGTVALVAVGALVLLSRRPSRGRHRRSGA